jgi:hypothetical protein
MRPEIGEVRKMFLAVGDLLNKKGSSHTSWGSVDWTKHDGDSLKAVGLAGKDAPYLGVADESGGGGGGIEGGGGGGDGAVRVAVADLADDDGCGEDYNDIGVKSIVSLDSDGGGGGAAEVLGTKLSLSSSVDLVGGWHPQSGSHQERVKAMDLFWKKPLPSPEDMARWYEDEVTPGGSPWCLLLQPRKWKIEGFEGVRSPKTVGGNPNKVVTRAISNSTSTTFLFESSYYIETVRSLLHVRNVCFIQSLVG